MSDADENDELIQEFLLESYENLDQLDRDFVQLEQDPGNRETLSGIFRTIHTIKGTSGFLAFGKLEGVTHVGENLLSRLREGTLDLTPEITTALLSMVDVVREMLSCVEQDGGEGDTDYSELVATLKHLNEVKSAAEPAGAKKPAAKKATRKKASRKKAQVANTDADADAEDGTAGAEASETEATNPGAVVPERAAAEPASIQAPAAEVPAATAKPDAAPRPSIADSAIRVDVSQLDSLMNLVGELVLARNQILQHSSQSNDATLLATCQRLNLITTELQGGVMKTRMQPIGNVWSKFPRVVRDLAAACGKQIEVQMEGKDTEVDKTILESIKDPLTHIVRNSCDHGLEPPEVRSAAGKPANGTIWLRAYHEGGLVNLEVADDGGGIDPEKIKAKAIDKGLVSPAQAEQMSDRDLVNLVFAPGFSTAEKVTNVSGRGVGMDVVRTNIEKIGGTVDIQSTLGEGTSIRVKIPLTLAIIPALITTTRGERYAIPQVSLLELVLLEGDAIERGIERVHGAPVYRLRGKLLPLVYLDRELGLASAAATAESASAEADPEDAARAINIVVLQAGDTTFGLVVDEVNDTEEIVVKPLGSQLKGIPAFAGATIMGDGRVALILDVLGLGEKAKVVAAGAQGTVTDNHAETNADSEREALLLFALGTDRRMAIPLALVARLEELERAKIETAGGRKVIQYRDEIMPLVFLSDRFRVASRNEDSEKMHVVVYDEDGRSVGLVVDEILDVLDEEIRVQSREDVPGVVGSAVVHGAVTDLLDVDGIVRECAPPPPANIRERG